MYKKLLIISILILLIGVEVVLASQFGVFDEPKSVNRQNALDSRLIKTEDSSAVYYQAITGSRYTIPNEKTFLSWFKDFSQVKTISMSEMEEIGLAGNVCYKPNSRLIKMVDSPKVYYVDKRCEVRHIVSEDIARHFFGSDWADYVDDIPEPFFMASYHFGRLINFRYPPSYWSIDDNKDLYSWQ
jgi:hypothetical protein